MTAKEAVQRLERVFSGGAVVRFTKRSYGIDRPQDTMRTRYEAQVLRPLGADDPLCIDVEIDRDVMMMRNPESAIRYHHESARRDLAAELFRRMWPL